MFFFFLNLPQTSPPSVLSALTPSHFTSALFFPFFPFPYSSPPLRAPCDTSDSPLPSHMFSSFSLSFIPLIRLSPSLDATDPSASTCHLPPFMLQSCAAGCHRARACRTDTSRYGLLFMMTQCRSDELRSQTAI